MSLLGPIVLCLVVYLRWQLGDVGASELASGIFSTAVRAPRVAANDCSFVPSPADSAVVRACAASARREEQPEPAWLRAPGVYVDASDSAADANADATVRGQRLAERIIHASHDANVAPRRGTKGALDVIVVGANLLGISATLRLMQAGLRVLLVDGQSWAPVDAAAHRLFASRPGAARRMRLPLVTGHHVSVVAQRADGMLELQAERAAWYTANVIFASRHAAAPVNELIHPLVACTPAAPRAA